MFEVTKPIYMTRAVEESLSFEHKLCIVSYIREQYEVLTDYLQVFEFFTKMVSRCSAKDKKNPKGKRSSILI